MEDNFPRNLTKGKIAETIFWLMFRDTEYTILPFGYEQVLPVLAKHHNDPVINNNVNVIKFRSHPDFILVGQDKTVLTIDVKYCHDLSRSSMRSKATEMLRAWQDCYFFIATPEGFFFNKCQEISEKGLSVIKPLSSETISDKIQNYYTDLLNEFIRVEKSTSKNHNIDETKLVDSPVIGNVIFDRTRTKPSTLERAGKPWNMNEDKQLIAEYDQNNDIRTLANKHQRSDGAIRSRLIKLGKIEVPVT